MKKLIAAAAVLLASTATASAADMAVKARPMLSPVPIASWTGFFVGVHVGAGWGETESTLTGFSAVPPIGGLGPATFALPFSQTSYSGFLGGVQAGANWQSGWAVIGVQGDFAGADIKGTSPCFVVLGCTTKTDWLATLSGRVGAVVLDRGLVYAKGGVAWMNSTHSVSAPNFGLGGGGFGVVGNITSKEVTHFGWLVGLGTEWMITNNWTAFIEYNYIEFEKTNQAFPINFGVGAPFAVNVNADLKNNLSLAKVGVNYKFDWARP